MVFVVVSNVVRVERNKTTESLFLFVQATQNEATLHKEHNPVKEDTYSNSLFNDVRLLTPAAGIRKYTHYINKKGELK